MLIEFIYYIRFNSLYLIGWLDISDLYRFHSATLSIYSIYGVSKSWQAPISSQFQALSVQYLQKFRI